MAQSKPVQRELKSQVIVKDIQKKKYFVI